LLLFKQMKSIIVAYDEKRGIGAKNDLLWQRGLPADLRRFKDLTTGHAIVMGRKTFDSIGRALPNRQNIVISRQATLAMDGVTLVDSLEAAYKAAGLDEEVFIIGGGEIYKLAINDIDRIYATEVGATFNNADTFFPPLDLTKWREVSRDHHVADERNAYAYDFVTYERV
jgi:dihydrofolate reductase